MNILRKVLLSTFIIFNIQINIQAQIAINNDGAAPDASAMLEITSTDKGVLIPRITSSQRMYISSPATGLLVYDTDENSFWYYDGNAWAEVGRDQTLTLSNDNLSISNGNTIDLSAFKQINSDGLILENGFAVQDASQTSQGSMTAYNNTFLWQTFTAENTGTLAKVGFYNGTTTPITLASTDAITNGQLKIFEGSDTSSTLLYAATINSTHSEWNYYDLSNHNIEVTAGTQYVLYLSDATDGFYWSYEVPDGPTNAYDGGAASQNSNNDMTFSISVSPSSATLMSINDNGVSHQSIDTLNFSDGTSQTTAFNHIATQSLQLNDFWLSNDDDDNEGISISNDGNTTLSGTLTIGNTYTLPATDGAASQILVTDGSGSLSWSDVSLTSLSDTDGDTKIQVEESSDEDIIRFDLKGTEFMRLDSGRIEILNTGNSIFIGEGAGENDDFSDNSNTFLGAYSGRNNTEGSNNNFIGTHSGRNNIEGSNNNFIGTHSGRNNTEGSNNNFIGTYSGYNNTTGNNNIFLGVYSGYLNIAGYNNIFQGAYSGANNTTGYANSFIGHKSGYDNTTGYYNSFIGVESGYANSTGNSNTFIGVLSGRKNETGNSNVFLGFGSGYYNISGEKNVFIGYKAGYNETGSNKLYIDNSNTSSPLIYGEFDNDILEFNASVGIGTTPTKAVFEVSGNTTNSTSYSYGYLKDDGTTGAGSGVYNYSIYASSRIAGSAFHAISDERIKNIQGISNSKQDLSTLMNIQITDYTMKDSITHGNQEIKKVIAQQVKSIYPQAVTTSTVEVVPDIYQTATIDENGWVTGCELRVASSRLKVGEKVKIIFEEGEELLEVLEVKENAFRVSTNHQGAVFVYGKEVNDFHTVDYEAISMLNVSATQQLAKEVEQLKAENTKLKLQQVEIDELKAMLQQIQAQLEATTQSSH